MDRFTKQDLKVVLQDRPAPCVSVYMPTKRGGGEEAPILWRVHLKEIEEWLSATGMRSTAVKAMVDPARQLLDDVSFWKRQCDGLACFLAPHFIRTYRLPYTFRNQLIVGKRFQITPLIPIIDDDLTFYILALSQNGVRLLRCTRYDVNEVELTGVPENIEEALRTHDVDEPLTFHTRRTSGGTYAAIYHGHGVGIDDAKDDILRYFQQIDRGLRPILSAERSPLILSAVQYLQPIYRKANHYPHLFEDGIVGAPDRLSNEDLHARALDLLAPAMSQRLDEAIGRYHKLAVAARTSCDLKEILPAACDGIVDTLFIPTEALCWGRFDAATQSMEVHDDYQFGDEDLLNLAATFTLRHGQNVYVVEQTQAPDGALAAAVFHFPRVKCQ